jgi:hypothetical protein
MSRARRLAEIAKANQPAFSGTQWWLADPSTGPDPAQPEARAGSAASPQPERVAVAANAAVAQLSLVAAPAASSQEPASSAVHAAAPLIASEAATEDEPERNHSDLATRLIGLKEKFLWLGRKSRSVQPL